MKKRIIYAILSIALLAAEILIAKYTAGFIRGSVGDILVVVLIFCLIRTILPDFASGSLPAYVFAFSCVIELLQLIHFVELMGAADNHVISTALGGTFSFYDLLCYAVGALICYAFQYVINGNTGSNN